MKRIPLLLITILAMSITTLFTACPEPEIKASARRIWGGPTPDAVTNIVPKRTKDWFAVTATPPDNRGTKADGKPVGADEIKYTLYYAHANVFDTLMDITSITVDVIQREAEKDGIESRLAGKVSIQGDAALKEGFKINALKNTDPPLLGFGPVFACLTQPHYYFIRAEHPEDPELFADSSIMSMMRDRDKKLDYCP